MTLKIWGGIFLVIGTSIGAGILALPLANAVVGFWWSSCLMILCWCAMTFSALLLLEVNLWLPEGSNLITMVGATLGRWGQGLAWFVMLLLLYALLSGYIAGGSDVLSSLRLPGQWPYSLNAIAFTTVLGMVVSWGTCSIDYVNRCFMSVKLLAFIALLIFIFPHVQINHLQTPLKAYQLLAPLTVIITSFGYGVIIPSLRTYFESDLNQLRRVVFIGSLIPLACYLLWDFVIMGVIPLHSKTGLLHMLHSGHSTSELMHALDQQLQSHRITVVSRLFTSISMITSFLGVALALSDFLADGFHIKKTHFSRLKIDVLTFMPPLLVVLFYPGVFIKALNYAGILCGVLLILLPCAMAWRGRYIVKIARGWQVKGGKPALLLGMATGIVVVVLGIMETF
ncbi:MAG: amino acid permease [Gammaproteobacteria bacterium]